MNIVVFPTYGELFPNEPIPEIEILLETVPTILGIQVFSYLNSRTHLHPFDLKYQEDIFAGWISSIEINIRKQILSNYLAFKSKIENGHPKGQITIFNPITLLSLVEDLILNQSQKKANENTELLFLKLYLLKNEKANEEDRDLKFDSLRFHESIITHIAGQYEFTTRKDIFSQLLLSIEFFKYMSADSKFKPHYEEFIMSKGVKASSEYLIQIVSIYNHCLQNTNTNNFKLDNDFFIKPFFDSLSHDLTKPIERKFIRDKDFKLIRDKPLVKIDDNTYCPIHFNFFIDKVYSGLIFDFYKSTTLKNTYPNFSDYLKELGTIIEETIFHKYIEKCFKNKYIAKANGSKHITIEYSDYYARQNKSIFLFEFKNSIVKSSIKYSGSYKLIEDEIRKKLYYDEATGKDKGVKQLKKVISKLEKTGFEFDKYHEKVNGRIEIYPIIVYTDQFFSIDGINYYLKKILIEELEVDSKKVLVNELILISLEFLFDIISSIDKKEHSFKELCNIYYKKVKSQEKKGRRIQNEKDLNQKFRGFDTIMYGVIRNGEMSKSITDIVVEALKE